jgi:hypothetical protein
LTDGLASSAHAFARRMNHQQARAFDRMHVEPAAVAEPEGASEEASARVAGAAQSSENRRSAFPFWKRIRAKRVASRCLTSGRSSLSRPRVASRGVGVHRSCCLVMVLDASRDLVRRSFEKPPYLDGYQGFESLLLRGSG